MQSTSQQILKDALQQYAKKTKQTKPDVGTIARKCGLSYSTVYNPLFNNRPTNAEIFLKILYALGAIKTTPSGLKITAKTPLAS